MKMRKEQEKLWWIVPSEIENERASALVRLGVVSEYQDFNKFRRVVWFWFRRACAREDLTSSAKIMLWAIVERYRWETMSSHDAINYYALMVGMNRKTAGRAVGELAEKELIWIVPREEKKRLKKSRAEGHIHFLLVGLGYLLKEGELR